MVTEDPVDLNLTMSPSSRKIPALLTKNSAQPCQAESCGENMWIRVRTDDDDDIFIFLSILRRVALLNKLVFKGPSNKNISYNI